MEEMLKLREAINELAVTMSDTLQEAMQEVVSACQVLLDALWQAYRQAGTPYGDSLEGMLRWVRECGEANRLQMKAASICAHHQSLANLRQVFQNDPYLRSDQR